MHNHDFIYELGKTYNTNLDIQINTSDMCIQEEFHSYGNKHKKKIFPYKPIDTNYKVMHCIIPKRTKYYINEFGEYISKTIIPISLQN